MNTHTAPRFLRPPSVANAPSITSPGHRRAIRLALTFLTALAVLFGAQTITSARPASAAPMPAELIYSNTAVGMDYDSGKAREYFKNTYGGTRVEDFTDDFIRDMASVPSTHANPGSNLVKLFADAGATGTITFEPGAVTVRIKTASVHASSFGDVMKYAAIIASAAAVQAISFFGCMVFTLPGTGGNAPLAAIICKAAAGGLAAMAGRLIKARLFNESMGTGAFWAEVVGYFLAGALSGAALEKASQWTKVAAPVVFERLADAYNRFVFWLGSWAPGEMIASRPWLHGFLRSIADSLPNALRRYIPGT